MGQRDCVVIQGEGIGHAVKRIPANRDTFFSRGGCTVATTQKCADSDDELPHLERFLEIIVGPDIKPLDNIVD